MPDVKAPPCEYSPVGSPAACSMDLERCLSDLPAPLSILTPPLSSFSHHTMPPYPGLDKPPACNNNNSLLTNLGLRYCSTSSVHPSVHHDVPQDGGLGCFQQGCMSTGRSRLYHSMENLHWTAVSDSGVYALNAPCRSVDSEFILHCTSRSHWYGGPGEGAQAYGMMPSPDGMAFYPRRGFARKDLPLFPQWLFPAVEDLGLNGNARRGLREKLRLQSTRVTEPHKPLRPQAPLSNTPPPAWSCDKEMAPRLCPPSSPGLSTGQRALYARQITSPEEIKQEVLRRLQLRRQRSTPNLALNSSQEHSNVSKSQTSDPVLGNSAQSTPEQKRPPVGRLHIPTFEEFKKMRQRENSQSQGLSATPSSSGVESECQSKDENSEEKPQTGSKETEDGVRTAPEDRPNNGASSETAHPKEDPVEGVAEPTSTEEDTAGAICTGPVPRSPLHSLAVPAQDEQKEEPVGSGATDATALPLLSLGESGEGPSSCCPAILLDGTDLSSYGAKISKMRDGFLGSALDLIKKSCSAEIAAEAPVSLSREKDDGADITAPQPVRQSAGVAMTMPACRVEASIEPKGRGIEEPTECLSGPGCRRSSSDAAYELAESVRAQRECRLRPHYSDPMPADAAKRKQLEMKIAAAARFHSQRRDRDTASAPVRGHSEPRQEGRAGGLGVTRAAQHRWSTISSLSADSGVVGLSDERDDEDEPRRARRGRGAEVERVDSGIGQGLARGWKRPSASLKAWEAQRPCPDCGQREGGREQAMCERCSKLRTERKEAILEFLNTESSYGEDLRIIKEEFYCPMQSAGLLTAEQLTVVFSNVQELIDVNERFTEHLQDSIDQAFDQGDEDLLTVCIGEIFLEFVNMLPAFQTYCLQQSTSVNTLNALEKEKELLRIFLDVSQNDNTALRRMNLRSFLMAPLQRVTKYPLLLSRISKATPECHPDYPRLREAKSRVESHLEHINMKTKQEGTATWSLRSFRRDSRKNREVINIEIREMSMKTVGWARENTRFIMEGPLQFSQPTDGQWVKKGSKSLKFQNVQSLLMIRTQRSSEGGSPADGGIKGEQQDPLEMVRDGVLVLIKDKSSGKFTVLREPIRLCNCVVSADPDCDDTFEVLDIRREAFVFRASDKSRTQQWFHQIKRYACDLGPWRKRRNALPNIMINTTPSRS
ncbi:rho guanine nucleotide exchange factor 17 [Chanos chanos]|uniref:Rho guanine nucleotide exchange factor 17 n=1 Tax=Chanos chanos TaxID=29144 RepID=A0A6J2WD76_CHACN|nr:rho guanine nucleotide exchange factor 17-like [Chanos chanos]